MRRIHAFIVGLLLLAGASAYLWSRVTPVDPVPAPLPRQPPPIVRSAELAEAAWLRGNAALEREDFDRAVEDYDDAIQNDGNYALAYVGRGNARLALQDYDAALSDFDAALARDPQLVDAYLSRSTTNWLLGKLEESEDDYRVLVRKYPNNSFFAIRYAGVLYEGGKKGSAEDFYRAVYRNNPANDWALTGWLGAIGANRDFKAMLNQALEIQSGGVDSIALRSAIGEAYYQTGDYYNAIANLASVEQGDATQVDPEVILHLAWAYRRTARPDACRQAFHNYMARMARGHQIHSVNCELEGAQ